MKSMKLRLLLMGCIITAIGGILVLSRGLDAVYAGFALLGVVLLVLGLLWK